MRKGTENSDKLFREAKKYIPGGVNSPVRAFKSVGMNPIFIARGKGSHIIDVDDNEYIDFISSWGPLILGHAAPEVINSVKKVMTKGTSFGAPTAYEVELADMVVEAVPSVEKVRMVSSGTEAVMSAIRLARAYTGRDKILKFEGCYHGHSDSLLVKAGSGVATLGLPDSPGVTEGTASDTLTVPYNNLSEAEQVIKKEGDEIACVILEPVAANMGVIPPREGFLKGLRELTKRHNIVLIFDEVITGFRMMYGGAQEYFGITPDMTCMGKIIGGGFPVGAFGGKKEIMDMVAPDGPAYQAGTLSGNPVAMAAGIAMLKVLKRPGVYDELNKKAQRLADGLHDVAVNAGIRVHINHVASMLTMFFTDKAVVEYKSAKTSDTDMYALFFRQMIEKGVYFPPSQFEAVFTSRAHSENDIEITLDAAKAAFKTLAKSVVE